MAKASQCSNIIKEKLPKGGNGEKKMLGCCLNPSEAPFA